MAFNAFFAFVNLKFLPFMYAIIGFGSLIAIHEFGHFFFCKLFGILTPTFSIGFGPELFRKKIGTTDFRLALIPLGGYCEIAGNEEVGQGEQAFAKATGDISFDSKAYWKKLLVMFGGIIFNLLFAYIVWCVIFMVGKPLERNVVLVSSIVKDSAAEKYGLKAGDQISTINGHNLADPNIGMEVQEILMQELMSHPNQEVKLIIERDKKELELPITLGSKPSGNKTIGSLGAGFAIQTSIPKMSFFQAITKGISTTNKWICDIASSVKTLISKRSLEGAGGPVMILSQSFSSAQYGFIPLFIFLALISINLALINLLPIGALDGGQILFVTLETIFRRRIPMNVKIAINLASWVFFIGLALFLTYKDIVTLFGDTLSGFDPRMLLSSFGKIK